MAGPPLLGAFAALTCVAWLTGGARGQDGSCVSFPGFRGGGTSAYEMVIVDSPEACCDLCAEQYPMCEMWNRDNRTGACGLSTLRQPGSADGNFTVGFWDPPPPPPRPKAPAGAPLLPAPLPAPAAPVLPLDEVTDVGAPCDFRTNHTFSGEYIVPKGNETGTAKACCQVCEAERTCFSWTWQEAEELCFMKNGVVSSEPKPGFFSGTMV